MSKKFKSQDYFRYPRLGTKWRRPKGRQSKLREKKGGSGQVVAIGHRTSRHDRNTINGMHFTLVKSLKELDGAKDSIIIASSIGAKKTKIIADKARQMNLKILNMKKVRKSARREEEIAKKKEDKKTKKQKEEAKKQETAKKADKEKAEKKQEAKTETEKKMGFHESVVPQLLSGKTKTYRVRDHNLKIGDSVAFENSQTGEIFGHAKITNTARIPVGNVDLKDAGHYKTYEKTDELIEALKKHNPSHEISPSTEVFVYTYEFTLAKTAGKKS